MSKQVETIFAAFELTEEELTNALDFTTLQKQYLQTEMAAAATALTTVVVDPQNPGMAILENAYYRGQVDILKYILGFSIDRQSQIQRKLLEQAANSTGNNPQTRKE